VNDRQLLKRKVAALKQSEIEEVLEYIAIMESLREEANRPGFFDDAFIYLFTDGTELHIAKREGTHH